jgi:hypothetical protein
MTFMPPPEMQELPLEDSKVANSHVLAAIKDLVDYGFEHESDDFHEQYREDPECSHIFRSVVTVNNWLRGQNKVAEDWLPAEDRPLKPCPFCGGKAKAFTDNCGGRVACDANCCSVVCNEDGTYDMLDRAIDKWNTRPELKVEVEKKVAEPEEQPSVTGSLRVEVERWLGLGAAALLLEIIFEGLYDRRVPLLRNKQEFFVLSLQGLVTSRMSLFPNSDGERETTIEPSGTLSQLIAEARDHNLEHTSDELIEGVLRGLLDRRSKAQNLNKDATERTKEQPADEVATLDNDQLRLCPFCGDNARFRTANSSSINCFNPQCGAEINFDCSGSLEQRRAGTISLFNKRAMITLRPEGQDPTAEAAYRKRADQLLEDNDALLVGRFSVDDDATVFILPDGAGASVQAWMHVDVPESVSKSH